MEQSNLAIIVNKKHVGTPCLGHGSNSFDMVVAALKAAGTESFTVTLLENFDILKTLTYPEGNWIRIGSKVQTRHGIAIVTGIDDTTMSRSEDPKEGGKEVKKFLLGGKTKGRKNTAVIDLDNMHYTYSDDGITVLEY